ncbi:MAG: sigma-70 family RNA polymerase sigma factor [Defluviitaleaceae bacterium]|nr:sigma-70 family RNA polymerase sigma factor [Defluviitaleaceae bacterium]
MSLEETYQTYFPKIYNYIFYRVMNKHDAEDITSTVFLKVAEHFGTYDPAKASFSSWIFKIAENALTDYFRARRVSVNVDDLSDTTAVSVDFEGEALIINDENLRELYIALSRLGDKTRDIIAQKYFQGKTIRQIAKDKKMNESTVSTMHNRGLENLRKSMNI